MEYSKDLFSCRVLDDQLTDGRYAVVDGAIDPMRGVLVSLQEVPKDLICGDQGKIHEQDVPLLIYCETL